MLKPIPSNTQPPAELAALESRLQALEQERASVLEQIRAMREDARPREVPPAGETSDVRTRGTGTIVCESSRPGLVNRDSPAAEKVALFADLFRGRPDIHAVRWENLRSGRSGLRKRVAGWSVRQEEDSLRGLLQPRVLGSHPRRPPRPPPRLPRGRG